MKTKNIPKERDDIDKTLKWWLIFFFLVLLALAGLWTHKMILKDRIAVRLDAFRQAGYPATSDELEKWHQYPPPGQNAAELVIEAMSHSILWSEKSVPQVFDLETYQQGLPCKSIKALIDDPNIPGDRKADLLAEDWRIQNNGLLPLVGIADMPEPGQPLHPLMKQSIEDYVKENEQTLNLLRQAATIKQSRYPVDWSEGFETLLPDLGKIRHGVKLLKLEAVMHMENHQPDLAIESFQTANALAATLNKEPTLTCLLVKIACQSLNVTILKDMLGDAQLSNDQLRKIEDTIIEMQNESDMTMAFIGEYCRVNDIPSDDLKGYLDISKVEYFLLKVTGLWEMDCIRYLDRMQEYMAITKLPWPGRLIAAKKITSTIGEPSRLRPLTSSLAVYDRLFELCANNEARLVTARTAVAVERYRLANNVLPDDLAELTPVYLEKPPVDPFDGKPLRYKKNHPGYIIYSIGMDLYDNHGDESSDTTFTVRR